MKRSELYFAIARKFNALGIKRCSIENKAIIDFNKKIEKSLDADFTAFTPLKVSGYYPGSVFTYSTAVTTVKKPKGEKDKKQKYAFPKEYEHLYRPRNAKGHFIKTTK